MLKHIFLLLIALCLHIAARGQTTTDAEIPILSVPIEAQSLQYWFDTNTDNMQTVSGLTGAYTLDVSSLADGLHTLHYQVIGTDDNSYGIASEVFLKMASSIAEPTIGTSVAASTLQYWYDTDISNMQTVNGLTGAYTLDVSSLADGLHTLHYQVMGADGNSYGVASEVFLKMASSIAEPTIGTSVAASTLQYWYDTDISNMQTVNGLTGAYTLDVSSLADGLHTLHYQVIGTDGNSYGIASEVFLKMANSIAEPTIGTSVAASTLQYWYDTDISNMQTVNGLTGAYTLDVSSLADGLHTLHYQVIGTDGNSYGLASEVFLKMFNSIVEPTINAAVAVSKLEYWFDTNTDNMQTLNGLSGIYSLDVSELEEGLHTLHFQVVGVDSTCYDEASEVFLKMTNSIVEVASGDTITAAKLQYWFDSDTGNMQSVSGLSGVYTLDVSSLIDGLHTLHFKVEGTDGKDYGLASEVFLKMVNSINEPVVAEAPVAKNLRYWFNNDFGSAVLTNLANGIQTLDVSALPGGLHTLYYQIVYDDGKVGPAEAGIFLKNIEMPEMGGPNGITQYQYWLNNDRIFQTVTLDAATNPYQLVNLLPIQKMPIRSSSFHFEVTDGVPMVYAKNDFHIRFHDARSYFVDDSRQYIDYSVKQEVVPAGELQATQTFDKVADNNIRWYTMQAAPGDTVAFKLTQPATVQLFAPSGAEVFNTSESASVKWGGIHTWEDGTYYLAVHDVTGSQSTMKLEYMHMDKYDVVDWDVHRVGNGGCSTITFKGNGFRDLYAVDLVIAPGDTIHSVDVSHDSDAETAVTFDFTGAELGEYNAVFHFTEEDKHVSNVVTVEEAIDIELATDVSFPSSFLRGTSTTYTIKITNKGNMTAYNVPVYVYVSSKNATDITRLSLKGLDLLSLYDFMDTEYWTEEECQEMKEYSDEIGDEHYFYKIKLFDDNFNDSVVVRKAFLFVSINPSNTKQFTLTLHSQQKVNAYFTIPTEWNSLTENETSDVKQKRRKEVGEKYCCFHDGFECALNSFAYTMSWVAVGGLAAGQAELTGGAELVGCISSGISMLSNIGATFACDRDRKLLGDKLRFGKLLSWAGTAAGCFTGSLKAAKEVKTALSFGINKVQMPFTIADCAQAGKNPNCPPGPQGGGTSTPQPPVDPNDIFGYLSEAGSKFIADSVARVNYTIEFENDTTFATAAAHTIVIKDTLDSRYFNLTKFMPTGVRIGGHDVFLNEADIVTNNDKTTFVKTIDMRPEINAIAQVNGEYNQKNGIAQWTFQSLDPMTMEPTDDLMQGILPVNYDGTSGIGEVMFEIGVKQGKADGTELKNRAGIVFDYEEAILTPTWTNIVDAVAPSSVINDSWMVNDSTLRITADGFDARSGVWKYEWSVQAGENAPWWKEGETESASFDYHIYEGIDYGFCVLAVDSAGNVEQKVIQRERGFKTYGPDYEDNISPVLTSPEVEGSVYDLSGRKHDEPQENQINIIDKKKILFRRKGK